MSTINLAVLALYPAVIVFAWLPVWLYAFNVLLPAWRRGQLNILEHALIVAVVAYASADLTENIFYGTARIFPEQFDWIESVLPWVGAMKVIILMAGVFAVAAYEKSVHDRTSLPRLVAVALAIWIAAFFWLMTRG